MYSNLTKWLIDIEMHIKQEFWPTNLISHKVWCYLQIRTMPWFPNLNHQTTKIENVQKTRNDGTKFSMRNMRNSFMTHEMALNTCNTCNLENEKQFFCKEGFNELWL
jgi:hypothetical protein